MVEHTKGPLRLNAGDGLKVMDADNRVAFYAQCGGMTGISLADAESNAETMVARWNALEGYNPEAVRDVVEALRSIACFGDEGANRYLAAHNSYGGFDEPNAVSIARAALRRLEGGAS